MRYPDFLKPGGRIGCIAPSFGCVIEPYRSCFDRAQRVFSDMGYKIVRGPNCYEAKGLGKSNTPQACAAEIRDFFCEDKSDIILSCGGGETMCEDLSYVDFAAIGAAKPKWYMGYSDNTNLTFTLPVLCDTAAIYAPCMPNFGMQPWHRSIEDAFAILTGTACEALCGPDGTPKTVITVENYDGWESESLKDEENPWVPYHITEPFEMKLAGSAAGKETAQCSGRLIGGCLDCLVTLCGTSFDKVSEFADRYKDDGILWFIEACDLNPMGIRRALWQLDAAGWFKNAKGFLIGRALHFDEDMMGMNRLNAVTGLLEKYQVPIFLDVDLGHLPPMMPLVAGAYATAKADHGNLRIRMELI